MNHTEEFSNILNSTEDFSTIKSTSKRAGGVGRGQKYPGAEIPEQGYDDADFLIMEQAYAMFESEGERRSVRMIAEYCKTGELVCAYDSDDKRWHITKESVENKIAKIKALNTRRAAAEPESTSERFSEQRAAPQRTAEGFPPGSEAPPPPSEEHHAQQSKIAQLEQEVFSLKVDKQARDQIVSMLREQINADRTEFVSELTKQSHRVGVLETKLLQLEAPKDQTAAPQTPLDHAVPYRDVEDVSSSSPLDPTSSVSPNEPLPNNVNTYEHSPQQP